MGPAGKEYVYKDDLRRIRAQAAAMERADREARVAAGAPKDVATEEAQRAAQEWLRTQDAEMSARYERELMNPREALSLGSISEIVMPADLRAVLGRNLESLIRAYEPGPMGGPQREFH
jgi:acetyl-CoA carboxylase carboxyltransferase component